MADRAKAALEVVDAPSHMPRPQFESPAPFETIRDRRGPSLRLFLGAFLLLFLVLGGAAGQYYWRQANKPALAEELMAKCDEARRHHRHLLVAFPGAPEIKDRRFLIWQAPVAQRAAWSLEGNVTLALVLPDGTLRADGDGNVVFSGGEVNAFLQRASDTFATNRRRRGDDEMTLSSMQVDALPE